VTDVRSNTNANLSSSQSNSFDLQQIAAALEDKLDIRMNRFEKYLIDIKNSLVTPTGPLKAVTEQFQTAAVSNFIQNRQNLSNQTCPPGFHQPAQQNNNQNRFQGNNLNQNRQPNQGALYQNRPPQNPNFQALPQNAVTQVHAESLQQTINLKFFFFTKQYNPEPKGRSKIHYHQECFADALIHMPKFAPMIKKLLNNKDKLIELTKTPLNENCSAVVRLFKE
nr:reverse transcriptase domain-containing protein [Tanacetum cinerariifolium]